MKLVYPVFIKAEDDMYVVSIPDFKGHTQGKDIYDAMNMAREYINLQCISYEENGMEIPQASSYALSLQKEKEFADGDAMLDYSDGIYTLVDTDLSEYKKKMQVKTVRRNVTLPSWMDYEANRLNINVSRVLQEALQEKLQEVR